MNAIAFKVNRKSGDYIRTTVVPPDCLARPHINLADGTIVAFLLLIASGLIYLLAN
jgi:hypothetical protein